VDRIIVMDEGQVIADGPKDDILRQLQSGGISVNHAPQQGMEARQ
jgi:ATP-binding cassette subfamily C protein LapB